MGNAGSRQQLPDFPPELLAEIFNFACDDYKQHVHNVMNDIHPFWFNIERKEYIVTPGTLSRVCRAWKDFAYRTPVLWDTVFVDMDSDPRYATYKDLDSSISEAAMKLKKWLDRAGNFPLTVKIDGPDLVHRPLLACSSRWKSIDVRCLGNHPELYAEMERIMKEPLLLLESFTCRASSHCSHLENHPSFSISATRKLKRVTMFQEVPFSILPSLGQIEVCRWNGNACLDIMDKLKDMKSITDCTIFRAFVDQISNPPLSRSLLRLSLLENLTLQSLREHSYLYLLQYLELPLLRRFTFSNKNRGFGPGSVRNIGHVAIDLLSSLLSFFQRSNSPNIQSLDLYILVGQIPADMLLDILRIAPNLKHFKIGFGGYYIGTRPNISMSQSSTVPDLVVLDSLISYHIDMSDLSQDSDINAAFLKYLSLPALNDFQVLFPPQQTTKINRKSQVTYLAALDLVKRSSCPLRSLKIDTEANIPETALFNLLNILPSLEYLCLVGQNYNVGRLLNKKSTADVKFHITSSFFKLLIPRPRSSASTIYLPKLRDLSLEGILTANGDEVLSALEYRWKGDEDLGIQKLSRVRLYSPDFIGKPTDKRFRRRYEDLQLQGMDVEFGKPS